ncbi:FAD-dependent oxidoreductase [Microbispora sp. NPDC049125]|uniref:FAD-dependent oxidoreductase n=1 Tax=Microbispora sp. NPDC049125 TaxID=3154929 RepID=UPI0034673180
MPHPHVIVIGAGPGGLCLANGLRRQGVSVAVYESDDSPNSRHQGYRLHIDDDGDRALARTLPPALHELFLATAEVLPGRTPVYDDRLALRTILEPPGALHLAVDRLTLREILLAGVTDLVAFGRRLTGYTTGADGRVTARFSDGTTATGDVLVAADGVNSVIRRQYLPHARIADTGLRQIYGKVPLTARTRELFPEEMLAVFTPIIGPDGSYVGVGSVRFPEPPARAAARIAAGARLTDVRDYVSCSYGVRRELLPCSDDELRAMPGEDLRALTLKMISGWNPRIRTMIEHWDPATVFPLSLRTSVPVAPWPATNVTLLGDAVHAMSPAAGVGANTALRDASALAEALGEVARGEPAVQALARYEAAMTEYGFAAVRTSAENGHRLLGQDPLPAG